MSAPGVTARLREMSRLLDDRGVVSKGVDMSAASVTARLRMLSALSDLGVRLARWGESFRSGPRPDS